MASVAVHCPRCQSLRFIVTLTVIPEAPQEINGLLGA
ncbi:IS1 family transposase [Enterobacter asburiae]